MVLLLNMFRLYRRPYRKITIIGTKLNLPITNYRCMCSNKDEVTFAKNFLNNQNHRSEQINEDVSEDHEYSIRIPQFSKYQSKSKKQEHRPNNSSSHQVTTYSDKLLNHENKKDFRNTLVPKFKNYDSSRIREHSKAKIWRNSNENDPFHIHGEILYGVYPVLFALTNGRRTAHKLYIKKDIDKNKSNIKVSRCVHLARDKGIEVIDCSVDILDGFTQSWPHQGICLDVSPLKFTQIRPGEFLNEVNYKLHAESCKEVFEKLQLTISEHDLVFDEWETDASVDKMAERMCSHLQEAHLYDLMFQIVRTVGVEKCIHLIKFTDQIQANGGLRIIDGTRMRTTGGVFLFVLKSYLQEDDPSKLAILFPNNPVGTNLSAHCLRDFLLGPKIMLILDAIHDPMNFGAILRSAYYFGVSMVVTSSGCCPLSPIASKASAGVLETMSIHKVENLHDFVREIRECGWHILGTAMPDTDGAKPLSDITVSQRTALLIGNEGYGVSQNIRDSCDESVCIMPRGKLQVGYDSLNVSVATGVLLSHLT